MVWLNPTCLLAWLYRVSEDVRYFMVDDFSLYPYQYQSSIWIRAFRPSIASVQCCLVAARDLAFERTQRTTFASTKTPVVALRQPQVVHLAQLISKKVQMFSRFPCSVSYGSRNIHARRLRPSYITERHFSRELFLDDQDIGTYQPKWNYTTKI